MKFLPRFFFVFLVIVALVACNKKESEPEPGVSPLSPVVAPAAENDSPLPPPGGAARLRLDKPLLAGANTVTGQGPAEIPLQVVDITAGGEILGGGVIGDDNQFSIDLGVPIPVNHVIGIQLATAKDPDTWLGLWALRGEEARAVPQIGDFFDSAISSPE